MKITFKGCDIMRQYMFNKIDILWTLRLNKKIGYNVNYYYCNTFRSIKAFNGMYLDKNLLMMFSSDAT